VAVLEEYFRTQVLLMILAFRYLTVTAARGVLPHSGLPYRFLPLLTLLLPCRYRPAAVAATHTLQQPQRPGAAAHDPCFTVTLPLPHRHLAMQVDNSHDTLALLLMIRVAQVSHRASSEFYNAYKD